MAQLELLTAPIVPLRTEEDGTIRVGQTRVTLDVLMCAYKMGASVEELAESFEILQLADIKAVIAYYHRSIAEVDAYLERRAREAEALRREIEVLSPPEEFRERLLARQAQMK